MKKSIKRGLFLALAVLFIVTGFSGCDLAGLFGFSEEESIAVDGTWLLDSSSSWGDWYEQWVITDNSITYSSGSDSSALSTVFSAEIVSYDNDDLNGGDSVLVSGSTATDCGYAVIKYTEVDGDGTGTVDKYNLFRWGTTSTDSTLRDFVQGYVNVGDDYPDNVNGVFDTADEAIAGATVDAGYFSYASSGASLQ